MYFMPFMVAIKIKNHKIRVSPPSPKKGRGRTYPFLFLAFKWIIKKDNAAGVIPEIREAWPREKGLI